MHAFHQARPVRIDWLSSYQRRGTSGDECCVMALPRNPLAGPWRDSVTLFLGLGSLSAKPSKEEPPLSPCNGSLLESGSAWTMRREEESWHVFRGAVILIRNLVHGCQCISSTLWSHGNTEMRGKGRYDSTQIRHRVGTDKTLIRHKFGTISRRIRHEFGTKSTRTRH